MLFLHKRDESLLDDTVFPLLLEGAWMPDFEINADNKEVPPYRRE